MKGLENLYVTVETSFLVSVHTKSSCRVSRTRPKPEALHSLALWAACPVAHWGTGKQHTGQRSGWAGRRAVHLVWEMWSGGW